MDAGEVPSVDSSTSPMPDASASLANAPASPSSAARVHHRPERARAKPGGQSRSTIA